jgi:hypothetical protein
MQLHETLVGVALITIAVGGCGSNSASGDPAASEELATQAVDSTDVSQNESAVLITATDPTTREAMPQAAAQSAASTIGTFYKPTGCATAVVSGETVNLTLANCTGPFGLLHMSGTVAIAFSRAADGLHAAATGRGLSINGASVDLDVQSVYTLSNGVKQLVLTTNALGTSAHGITLSRSGQYTVTWDSAMGCLGLAGNWSTTVAGVTWMTDAMGYRRCQAQCPAAGGSIAWTGARSGLSLTVHFDGSNQATWSTSQQRSGTVALDCASSS